MCFYTTAKLISQSDFFKHWLYISFRSAQLADSDSGNLIYLNIYRVYHILLEKFLVFSLEDSMKYVGGNMIFAVLFIRFQIIEAGWLEVLIVEVEI